ncbi:hypothetical protein M0804_004490 [Polistes exclamans]|nr:hypothetical protein M0804_004490 [Polistes exclamans]
MEALNPSFLRKQQISTSDICSPLLTIILPGNMIITNINLQGTLYREVSRKPYFRENFLDVFGGTHVRALASLTPSDSSLFVTPYISPVQLE